MTQRKWFGVMVCIVTQNGAATWSM